MTIEKVMTSNVGAMVGKASASCDDAAEQEKTIWVKLEGDFLFAQVEELQTFLELLLTYPCNRWVLQLDCLNAIGLRGVRALAGFAKVIQQRGYEVEIARINPTILDMLKDLNYINCFAWKLLRIEKSQ